MSTPATIIWQAQSPDMKRKHFHLLSSAVPQTSKATMWIVGSVKPSHKKLVHFKPLHICWKGSLWDIFYTRSVHWNKKHSKPLCWKGCIYIQGQNLCHPSTDSGCKCAGTALDIHLRRQTPWTVNILYTWLWQVVGGKTHPDRRVGIGSEDSSAIFGANCH